VRSAYSAGIALLALVSATTAHAQGRAIEDLRVSRIGNVATAEIVLACQAGVLDSSTLNAEGELRIRLTLHPECTSELGRQARDEIYRPPSGDLARIREMVFESGELGEAFVTVRFDAMTSVSVSQKVRRDSIFLEIDTGNIVAELADPENVVPLIEPPPARRSVQDSAPGSILEERRDDPASAIGTREPIRLVGPAPAGGPERFVVQLASGDIVTPPDFSGQAFAEDLYLYVNERAAGNRHWQELRAGFFDDEAAARAFLLEVGDRYPQAVIVVANELEQRHASLSERADRVAGLQSVEPTRVDEASSALLEERFSEARRALMTGDHISAIDGFAKLAQAEGFARREQSLEMLGVAYERNGEFAQARNAWNAYIAIRPEGPDSLRVRQRLAGLVTRVEAVPRGVPGATLEGDGRWNVRGGISQYYRDDRYTAYTDAPDEVTQSALLSHVDLSVRREGDRFDFISRVNGVYVYDLLDENNESDDQGLVSRAWFGIADKEKDWGVRIGRQTLYRSGVLGRFDGVTGNFRFKPDVVLNFTTGAPVDSPHSAYSDRRQFVGVSADLEEIVGKWDISVFSLMQQVDGIADREAVGGEAQYRGDRWHVLTALDLDLSYGVANSALVAANWQATDKLTFNTRVDLHAAPFLMTRNAIIGQPFNTVEDLLDIYSESQVRRIARDRTAQARSASLGFSWALFDRFQMNSDVTYTEFDATEASAGIEAFAASDPQLFFAMNFIGSSLFRDGDTAIFEFRHSQTRSGESAGIVLDFRLPVGSRVRINPRLAVTSRKYWVDFSTEWFVEPTLRVLMRIRQHHRFEAEFGGLWSNRGFRSIGGIPGLADQETTARFLNLGYWWEF
jgi:hypothetical protein